MTTLKMGPIVLLKIFLQNCEVEQYLCVIWELKLSPKDYSLLSVAFPGGSGNPTLSAYQAVQVSSNLCYYVSTFAVWPYPMGFIGNSQPDTYCQLLGFDLATVTNADEQQALSNFMSKSIYFEPHLNQPNSHF